ncbi:MAG: peptide-methionine (S)-S-oxide reductase MsrA [Patescibacteria group bacterium]
MNQTLIVGGGCFWCTEATMKRIKGVVKVEPGYAGGRTTDPSYEDVCTGATGHAEVIRITYDDTIVSYQQLIDVFFHTHDPTTRNAQGNDRGTQYRSIIFYQDEEEREQVEKMIAKLEQSGEYDSPIVTELRPYEAFYRAESYHLDYYASNPDQPYCRYVIEPKISKLLKRYHSLIDTSDR